MAENTEQKKDFEEYGGIQRKTTRFLKKDSDLYVAENAYFEETGGIGKKAGYAQQNSDVTSTTSTSTSTSTTTTSTSTSTSSSTSTSTTTTA